MIISRAPLRVSLAGGGSDLPSFYDQEDGMVLSFTINKYVYLALHDYFAGGIRVAYSQVEQVAKCEDLTHPIFRETMRLLRFDQSIEIGSYADVPSNGTGLGSSSAFTNALIVGLQHFRREVIDIDKVAALTCQIEIEKCHQPIGKQDQWATAVGGINEFTFLKTGDVLKNQINISSDFNNRMGESMKLFYLGYGRSAANILKIQNVNMKDNLANRLIQREIVQLVPEMKQSIFHEDIDTLGKLLNKGWLLKKKLANEISNPSIDNIYEHALGCGAVGGKVVGAGGGGFLLLCVPPKNHVKFKKSFIGFRELEFALEFEGTKIAYDDRSG